MAASRLRSGEPLAFGSAGGAAPELTLWLAGSTYQPVRSAPVWPLAFGSAGGAAPELALWLAGSAAPCARVARDGFQTPSQGCFLDFCGVMSRYGLAEGVAHQLGSKRRPVAKQHDQRFARAAFPVPDVDLWRITVGSTLRASLNWLNLRPGALPGEQALRIA
jgi:hypothetical protein